MRRSSSGRLTLKLLVRVVPLLSSPPWILPSWPPVELRILTILFVSIAQVSATGHKCRDTSCITSEPEGGYKHSMEAYLFVDGGGGCVDVCASNELRWSAYFSLASSVSAPAPIRTAHTVASMARLPNLLATSLAVLLCQLLHSLLRAEMYEEPRGRVTRTYLARSTWSLARPVGVRCEIGGSRHDIRSCRLPVSNHV